jgi:hypothetical protein
MLKKTIKLVDGLLHLALQQWYWFGSLENTQETSEQLIITIVEISFKPSLIIKLLISTI